MLLFNLYEITGKYFHTDTVQWKQYWERNKDKTLPPVRRFDVGSFGDVKLKFNDTFARKGSGPLVIALPMTFLLIVLMQPFYLGYVRMTLHLEALHGPSLFQIPFCVQTP